MLKNWQVTNFKAIESTDVDLGALTIVLGKNSVGKSSLIQSIIAMAQHVSGDLVESEISFIGNTQDLGPANLVLNRDALSKGDKSFTLSALLETENAQHDQVTFVSKLKNIRDGEVEIHRVEASGPNLFGKSNNKLACEIVKTKGSFTRSYSAEFNQGASVSLGNVKPSGERTYGGPVPSIYDFDMPSMAPCWLMDFFLPSLNAWKDEKQNQLDSPIRRPGMANTVRVQTLGRLLRVVEILRESRDAGKRAFTLLPQNLKTEFKGKRDIESILERFFALEAPRKKGKPTYFELNGSQASVSREAEQVTVEDASIIWIALSYLLALGEEAASISYPDAQKYFTLKEQVAGNVINNYFGQLINSFSKGLGKRVKYLGPMRAVNPSEQKNGRSESAIVPLGRSGEFMASMLHKKKTQRMPLVLPSGKIVNTSIANALEKWLVFFGIGERMKTFSREWATEFLLDGERTNQKGTGVSQILPVLITCLLARPWDIVILEQPELHLHPAHQRKLADFFATMSNSGVQIIAETHSEYLVTRLRLLVAEQKLPNEALCILFAEEAVNAQKKRTLKFSKAATDVLGNLNYWPQGFFDDSMEDRLLLSSLQFLASEL
jgi:predicted ATPase